MTQPSPEATRPSNSFKQILQHFFTPDLASTLGSIVMAMIIGAGLIALRGVNPLLAYQALFDGAFGNLNSIAESLIVATPLALAGIGVTIAFRAGIFNVGAEGQLYIGAIASTYVGLKFADLPGYLLIPLMILTAMLAGGLWAGIAGLLKVWMSASEMINTIMLNYIATFLVSYLVHGPLQEPGSPLGQTAMLPTHAWLVHILPRTRLHAGLIIAVIVSIIAAVVLWRTTWGFHIRVVGKNPIAAQAAGIKVNWILLSALMVSGAMAGLAGYGEVAGPQHRMIEYISPGYGYTAIVVALLGQLNPLGVLAAAILFGGLEVGATTMESAVGVPSAVVTVIQYLIVLFLIGRGAFDLIRQKLRREKQSEQHA